MKKHTILIVDDSPRDIRTLKEGLEQYTIQVATNGYKALDLANQSPPDVILMDVDMPDMDGYQTCIQLKQNKLTKAIPIIFISSHDTIKEIMKGYESGGSDYMTKPAHTGTLIQKIELALKLKQELGDLSYEADHLTKQGMSFLSNMGELGVIIDFLEELNKTDMFADVGEAVLKSIGSFDLNGSVQIRYPQGKINLGTHHREVSALEDKILSSYEKGHTLRVFGHRIIISYKWVSLFITKMPDDNEVSGRYRDHLVKIISSASDKIKHLLNHQDFYQYISKAYTILEDINKKQLIQNEKSVSILEEVLMELENNFTPWGLSDEQEKLLLQIVENGVAKSNNHFKESYGIDQKQREDLSIILGILQNMT